MKTFWETLFVGSPHEKAAIKLIYSLDCTGMKITGNMLRGTVFWFFYYQKDIKEINGIPINIVCEIAAFIADGKKIYRIAEDFGSRLYTTDLKISHKYLGIMEKTSFIEFPRTIFIKTRGERSVGVFISIEHTMDKTICKNNETLQPGTHDYELLISISFVSETGGFYPFYLHLRKNHKTIEEALQEQIRNNPENKIYPDILEAVYYVFKCNLYIKSGNPDLREQRPPRRPDTHKVKKIRQWEKENQDKPLVPITLVGYDFKKPKEYLIDKTWVSGHFRWQPYGKNYGQIKLIWIDPHERNFKTNDGLYPIAFVSHEMMK